MEEVKPLILVVDDNTINLKVLGNMLREKSYRTAVATNGIEALNFVSKKIPDMILLDIMMPEMDGYEVCRRLKSMPATRDIPVIFLSALSEIADKVKGFEVGSVDYVTKPFQQEEIFARVKTHLTVSQQASEIKKQNYFLQTLLDVMPNPLFYKDLSGVYLGCNSSFEKMTGRLKNEIIGKTVFDLADEQYAADHQRHDSELLANPGIQEYESKFPCSDGTLIDAIFYKASFNSPDGAVAGLIGLMVDITEIRESQEKLKQSEAQVKEINKKLELLARIDSLTNLGNRRYFEEIFNKEWRRAMRVCKPLSVIMMDIDFFKNYNDFYGHQKGDECLKSVARYMQMVLQRSSDFVARYGGEEFIAVLPVTDSDGAKLVAEKIRHGIEGLKIEHAKSQVSQFVTLSMGISSVIPSKELNPEKLVKLADDALYKAKRSGRNRIEYMEMPNE